MFKRKYSYSEFKHVVSAACYICLRNLQSAVSYYCVYGLSCRASVINGLLLSSQRPDSRDNLRHLGLSSGYPHFCRHHIRFPTLPYSSDYAVLLGKLTSVSCLRGFECFTIPAALHLPQSLERHRRTASRTDELQWPGSVTSTTCPRTPKYRSRPNGKFISVKGGH